VTYSQVNRNKNNQNNITIENGLRPKDYRKLIYRKNIALECIMATEMIIIEALHKGTITVFL
jgi:hypothetical protein